VDNYELFNEVFSELEFMLEQYSSNIDINYKDKYGYSYLNRVCSNIVYEEYNKNIAVISLFLMFGADVNSVSYYGWSPLLCVCYYTNEPNDRTVDIIELLLISGANVNQCINVNRLNCINILLCYNHINEYTENVIDLFLLYEISDEIVENAILEFSTTHVRDSNNSCFDNIIKKINR
jgi:ankyrin repeat protein